MNRTESKGMFDNMRWAVVVAFGMLPVVFADRPVMSGRQLLAAVSFSLAWLGLILLAWRRRSSRIMSIWLVAFIFTPQFKGLESDLHSLRDQWLALVIFLTGVPLLLAPGYFLRLADLRD